MAQGCHAGFQGGGGSCRTDTVRARVAAGLFERISEWNGYGRILLASTAGIEAKEHQAPGPFPLLPARPSYAHPSDMFLPDRGAKFSRVFYTPCCRLNLFCRGGRLLSRLVVI